MSQHIALLLVVLLFGGFFGITTLVLMKQTRDAERALRDEREAAARENERLAEEAERERRRLDLAARLECQRSLQKRVRSPSRSVRGHRSASGRQGRS